MVKVISSFYGYCPYKYVFMRNIREYCSRHGYTLTVRFRDEPFAEDEPEKRIDFIRNELNGYELLLWIDTDCIILDMSKKLESFNFENILITKEDVVQNGVMLFRNTDFTNSFLCYWENYFDEINPPIKQTYNHGLPVNNDYNILQTLIRILDRENLPIAIAKNTDFVIKHVHILDRTEDTFIMHVPGTDVSDKAEIMLNELQNVKR